MSPTSEVPGSSATLASPAARRAGWPKFPIFTLAAGAAGIVAVRQLPELERNLKGWITVLAIPSLVLTVLGLWFLITRRYSWRVKAAGVGLLLLLGASAKLLVKVDGTVDGRGLPRVVWRWTPTGVPKPPPLALPQEAAQGSAAAEAASLATADPRLAQAADVGQFFGPARDGVVRGARLSPDWKTNPPKELWRQPIGLGWSSFAVVGGRAYTQEQRGGEELVTCYDLFTGRLLWAHKDEARFEQWQGGEGPRSTPAVEGGRVYSYGATGLLNCLDAATGKRLWTRNVLKENATNNIEWGVSASPLLVDDKVVVTGGSTRGPVLFAYAREDGKPLWKAGDDQASYASPMVATLAGRRMILSNNAHALSFHDPATGAVLLNHTWGAGQWPKASQPVVVDENRVFISAGYGMGCLLLEIKGDSAGQFTATEVWTGMKMKTQFNSPILRGGHLYGLDDGRLACLSVADGERLWKEGRFGSGQSLMVDDMMLVQSESGPVVLAAARTDKYVELGSLQALSSKTWTFPTLSGRYLLVRNDREAVCYELPVQPATAASTAP